MPRYTDSWVIDKALFAYASGGSCACCSFPAMFHPQGLQGLISSISDLETDAANDEFQAAKKSPWPPEMRDQIWADRVRVRYKMKKDMNRYRSFFDEELKRDHDDSDSIEYFKTWIKCEIGGEGLKKLFQLPKSEVLEQLKEIYNVPTHGPFGTVMSAVLDQVANFSLTKYETDSRGEEEIRFEKALGHDKRGGFVLNISNSREVHDEKTGESVLEWTINEQILNMFVEVMVSLGGPKLLQRAPPSPGQVGQDDEGGADDAAEEIVSGSKGPSFRSDRRIARLLIARYWADQLIQKFSQRN